jgi:hypothetical protein
VFGAELAMPRGSSKSLESWAGRRRLPGWKRHRTVSSGSGGQLAADRDRGEASRSHPGRRAARGVEADESMGGRGKPVSVGEDAP